MRKLMALLLCLASFYACDPSGRVVARWENGQTKTIIYDGYQDNFIENYDTQGVKREEGFEVDNLRQGKWTTYDSLGTKESEMIYYRGLRFGLYTSFYPNGQKKEEGFFADGNKDDLWQIWDEEGNLLSEANYEDGVRVDPVIAFDQTVEVVDKGNMIATETTSSPEIIEPKEVPEVDPAVLEKESNTPANTLDGPWQSTYENGQIAEKGTYRNGQRIGTWRYYYQNGTKIAKGSYWGGAVEEVILDPSVVKKLKEEGQTDFTSLKIGVWQYWNIAGKPDRKVEYTIRENRYTIKEL